MASSSTTPEESSAMTSNFESPPYTSVPPLTPATSEKHRTLNSSRPAHGTRPSSSSVSSVQKNKKRVLWRGKTCIISLPTSQSRKDFKRSENRHPTLVLPLPEARTRPSFPDPEDVITERAERLFRTRLPNKAGWDLYVKELQEAKLQALGVSSGHEESRAKRPLGASPMSWHPVSHASSVPVSPSLVPPSTIGSYLNHAYGVPVHSQGTPGLGLRASSTSNLDCNPTVKPGVNHFPRYSISNFRHSPELPLSNGFVPSNFASAPIGPTIIPTFDGGVHPPYTATSAAEAISARPLDKGFLPHRLGDRASGPSEQQMMRQSKRQQDRQEHNRSQYPSSPSLPVDPQQSLDRWIIEPRNNEPAFQYPVPRSTRTGVPEALERQLHEAEGNPRENHDLCFNGDTSGQTGNMRRASHLDYTAIPKTTRSFVDVNCREDSFQPAGRRSEIGPLASSLNALAPEFRIASSCLPTSSSTVGTTMRPTAPAFTPASTSQQLPVSHAFTFLSTGPVFKPVPQITKAAKGSKVVATQSPKDEWLVTGLEVEVQEDESGRITQAEGRQKRQRRTSEGGLQDARFLSRAHTPSYAVEQQLESGDLKAATTSEYQHGRHHSKSLEMATQAANQLKEIIDDLSTSEDSSSLAQTAKSVLQEEGAFTFQDVTEAVAFDAARPRSSSGQSVPDQIGLVDELPTTYGSPSKRASISPSGSPIDDNRDSQHAETLLRRKSSATLPTLKPSSPLEERPQFEFASSLNEENSRDTQRLAGGVVDGIPYINPSYEELDAVIKHLDDEGPTSTANDKDVPIDCHIPNRISAHDFQDLKTDLHLDSKSVKQDPGLDNNSPQNFQYLPPTESESVNSSVVRLVAENARFSPSYRPSYASDGPLPVSGLGSAESAAISEWDKALSSSEEARSEDEHASLEACVNVVVSKVLEDRLMPLEESLAAIRSSLLELPNQLSNRTEPPRTPGNADISDADDEDDVDNAQPMTKSPTRDRKTDKLKAMMSELLASQPKSVPVSELETIAEDLKDLKTRFQEAGPPSADIKTAVEEAIGRQMRGRSGPITSSHQSATMEKSQLQIAGLESMLKIAEGRAEDEMKARRATEDALADSQRLLRLALQDAAEQRESAEETEQSLSAFHEERHEMLRRNALLEGGQENLQRTASELTEKNLALEGTLEEYRLSSAQWREEIESAKRDNKDLRRTVNALRAEMEDGINGRQVLRAKFDQLQEEMAAASQSIARDQSLWRFKEEEYKARCATLATDGDRQSQKCEGMVAEITALSERLRLGEHEHQQSTAELERQLDDQTKRANMERDRLQSSMDHEIQAMTSKLDNVRITSEGIIANIRSQLDQATKAGVADRAIFEQQLQQATASGAAAIEDHQVFHEQVARSLRDRIEQTELQCRDRLKLAEEKLALYQDKVGMLEEKLEVAKSAAQAAVQAVRSSRSTSKGPQQGPSLVSGLISSPPAKTSPQALRESILVLQEQLQDRESQIEEVQQKLSAVDTEAPTKLKAQQTEITWLRELLGVRIGDLEDLIAALSQPVLDREAIKDAAIRLKANLEMEQQEKERAYNGSQSFPSLAAISNLTSSPRSLPLAAAAAWGNWRKGRIGPVPNLFGSANGHVTETPSRSSPSSQSMLLSGLITPPQTDTRGENQSGGDSGGSRPLMSRKRPTSSTPRQNAGLPQREEALQWSEAPMTPSLTRRSNYDMDAESTEVMEVSNAVDGSPGRKVDDSEDEEAFGPRIAAFSGHV
ncbi:MAG: hypothetical protein Q9172_004701 [Xanthocarpia lactea]